MASEQQLGQQNIEAMKKDFAGKTSKFLLLTSVVQALC